MKNSTVALLASPCLALLGIVLALAPLPAAAQCECSLLMRGQPIADTLQLLRSSEAVCKAKAHEWTAAALIAGKHFDDALLALDSAAAIYQQHACSEAQLEKLWTLYASLHDATANYNAALEWHLKLLKLAETTDDAPDRATHLLDIAQVFNRMKQSDKGIAYTRQAVPIIRGLANSKAKTELLNKAGARYLFHAQDSKDMLYLDTAEVFVKEALATAITIQDETAEIIALTRLAAIYERQKDYDGAIRFIDQALGKCQPGKHNRQLITLFGDKGNALMKKGSFNEARRLADSCLHYSQREQYAPLIMNAWALIYTIEEKAGRYKEAMAALKIAQSMSDSLATAERTRVVNELERKYNQQKNERTIQELSQQKKIYLLLTGIAILGMVSIGFFLRQQSLKHKQVILETEQRLNRARMNPHFFFNALASLQSMAVKEGDSQNLAVNLSKFSHIMRETLESTYKEYVTIEQEIDFLSEYLELQKIRFPQKFRFHIQCDPSIEIDELLIPSMIIQPFVENSIEHGFAGMQHMGDLSICFAPHQQELRIDIIDNGKGLTDKQQVHKDHISRASQIIKDRIYLLNIKLKTKARFSIDHRTDQQEGVAVTIYLPIISKHETAHH
ncbi:MAG: histidine kinase [Chitinophagaceae bacterium]|nr:histidine kinase [Chitinophagaceae bacterium]